MPVNTSPLLQPQWPLFIVYPLSVAFFWSAYLVGLEPLCRWLLPGQYGSFNQFNQKCFRQNLLSGLHTLLSAVCLSCALLTDRNLIFGDARLYPHTSFLLYLDISMSFGYFSYALPMSVVMAKAGFPYGSRVMVAHHSLVALAQANFLLTRYPSGYMAASGLLFELTNVFFVPHVILLQLSANLPRVRTLLGVALLIVYTLGRCVLCGILCIMSFFDLRRFSPPCGGAGWPFALLGLSCFYGLLGISWYWYATSILPALHQGLQQACGEMYYHACCPGVVRRVLWRHLTREGRASAEEARLRFKALQELREEAGGDRTSTSSMTSSRTAEMCGDRRTCDAH